MRVPWRAGRRRRTVLRLLLAAGEAERGVDAVMLSQLSGYSVPRTVLLLSHLEACRWVVFDEQWYSYSLTERGRAGVRAALGDGTAS